jgi:intergrase/recombinase
MNFTSVIEGTLIWQHLQASILKSEMLMYVSNLWAFHISKMLILKVKLEIIDFYTGNAPPHQALPYIYRTY